MFQSPRRKAGRNKPAVALNIAPLIDMVFILLIFFMMTSTFVRDLGLDIESPRADHSDLLSSQSLRVSITRNGTIYVDDRRVDIASLRDRILRFSREDSKASVVVVPDEKTDAGRLVEVMDTAKLAGAKDIAVATRRKEASS